MPTPPAEQEEFWDDLKKMACPHSETDLTKRDVFGYRHLWVITCKKCGFAWRLDDDGVPLPS